MTGSYEVPRGPDVLHRIGIARKWLLRGEQVQFVLPRNLTCVACDGGGCDRCARSGAITLRSKADPAEVVRVTLPRRSPDELDSQPTFIVRVPGHGGLPGAESVETRGLLLLKIVVSDASDPGVSLVQAERSRRAPAPDSRLEGPASRGGVRRSPVTLLAVAAVLAWVLLIVLFSLSASR